ncbi:TetR/AcrR family transcriptional regulator [Saccharicrinis carchari]|nr:TetR/AcrR family transcriptional regulator [Saccharicrinis carchari]
MARDGKPTRDIILSESKNLVFENGFSGTSIDLILQKAGITKGAFFYHFKSKNALAKAMIEEYAREDMAHMNHALEKTRQTGRDPLHRLLEFIQEFIDMMTDLKSPPGCLYASYMYEPNQFSPDIKAHITETILSWRKTFEFLLRDVLEEYRAPENVDVHSLADMFTVIFEGALIVSKALNEPDVTHKQLLHLKNYFELLFVKK